MVMTRKDVFLDLRAIEKEWCAWPRNLYQRDRQKYWFTEGYRSCTIVYITTLVTRNFSYGKDAKLAPQIMKN